MRILHLGMGWFGEEVGGLSRSMSGAVVSQAAAGHDVRALVTGTENVRSLSGGLADAFAPPTDPLPRRLLRARRETASTLRTFDPEVVACHFALYGRPSLGLLRRRPWVMHFHGPWGLEAAAEGEGRVVSFLKNAVVEAPMYRGAARLVTLSRCFADILETRFGVDPSRIRVVPGGFDPAPFWAAPSRRAARLSLDLPPDRPLLVCVRRLRSRMGLENLVDAMSLLRERHPDLLLAIAGKGPLSAALDDRIRQAGLEDRVRLLGFVPDTDLPSLYSAADLSVVPTVALEGFGLVVAESLASGTPVVATRVGALPELLDGFAPQLLAEPSAQGLASTIGQALEGRLEVPDPGRCRDHANRWSWEHVAPATVRVYEEAAGT